MTHTGTYLASGGLAALLVTAFLTLPHPPATDAVPTLQAPECAKSAMPLEGRASPLDSASVDLHGTTIKVCYGRPSARGRTMIGGEHVPFGELWRTGANEATVLHTTGPIRFGEVTLEEGSYAIYTRPGAEEWQFYLSRSTGHWGNQITEEVRAQEVGSVTAGRDRPAEHVETLTIRFGQVSEHSVPLILEWEEFRVTVPVEMVHD
jgi:hypothetical protein